jgi:predicted secreted protein
MTKYKLIKTNRLIGVTVAIVLLATLVGASSASAEVECASCTPWWHLSSTSLPTNLSPSGEARITVLAENLGDGTAASPVTLTDRLPAGVEVQSVGLEADGWNADPKTMSVFFCPTITPQLVSCTLPEEAVPLRAFASIRLVVTVKVSANAKSGEEAVSVTGGGAPSMSLSTPTIVSTEPTSFGVDQYELRPENASGGPDTQAGSHPFQLTSVIGLKQGPEPGKPPAAVKDLHFDLPPGLIGNPTILKQCPLSKFAVVIEPAINLCPADTAIGVASVSFALNGSIGTFSVPLYNLVPSAGEPARFGFEVQSVPTYLDTAIRTGGDYGVTVNVNNITELANTSSTRVTFWGVPGDPRHDPARGWSCLEPALNQACNPLGQGTPPPFLTLPTACAGPVHTSVQASSWEQPTVLTAPFDYTFQDGLGRAFGMDGCNRVPFTPSIKVTPDGQAGSSPTGLTVDEHVPQETSLNPTGLAESSVKGLSVALPQGVALNPSAADGLQACSLDQIGLQDTGAVSCPEASKIATVTIKTPLLPNPLVGAAYLAQQDANPFSSLVAMYVYAEDSVSGVRAKAAGEVVENSVTGQLTAHFEGDPVFQHDPRFASEPEAQFLPEVPFEDIELHFFGGDRAPLATPALCGSYTTTGTFEPWSGAVIAESSSQFQVTSGPNGTPCSDPLPFNPSLAAGTTSIQAGGFTPFTMTMSRPDGQQNLQAIKLHMPPGLLGTLATVKLCPEAQANAGTCGPDSLIGHTIVSVGVGGDPYSVTGGEVFITEGYKGAPYGLSIVNPAKAGPFDLGKVVVRAKIEVDPTTAVLTITTDTTGPYKIPTILDGIPLQIQHVNVSIDRPGFTFNPTNCGPLAITGSLTSDQGTTKDLSVPFQITNCAVLAFKPKLTAKTNGKTSRSKGASLSVKLTYPAGPYDANISKVKVDLPKQLPSRLTTLQQACPAKTFEANPAACPSASIVGHAKATTPVLPTSLEGPAYFVSHGGEEFPELIIVLQGYGTTVHLVGSTFISKAGITSSTFKQVPDVPVGTFELTLPQGKYSALAANGNLCTTKKLAMPTLFTAQNGATIKTSTPIAPTGCAKHKAKHKPKAKHGRT